MSKHVEEFIYTELLRKWEKIVSTKIYIIGTIFLNIFKCVSSKT